MTDKTPKPIRFTLGSPGQGYLSNIKPNDHTPNALAQAYINSSYPLLTGNVQKSPLSPLMQQTYQQKNLTDQHHQQHQKKMQNLEQSPSNLTIIKTNSHQQIPISKKNISPEKDNGIKNPQTFFIRTSEAIQIIAKRNTNQNFDESAKKVRELYNNEATVFKGEHLNIQQESETIKKQIYPPKVYEMQMHNNSQSITDNNLAFKPIEISIVNKTEQKQKQQQHQQQQKTQQQFFQSLYTDNQKDQTASFENSNVITDNDSYKKAALMSKIENIEIQMNRPALKLIPEEKQNDQNSLKQSFEQQNSVGNQLNELQQQLEYNKDENFNLKKKLEKETENQKQIIQNLKELELKFVNCDNERKILGHQLHLRRDLEQQFAEKEFQKERSIGAFEQQLKEKESQIQSLKNQIQNLENNKTNQNDIEHINNNLREKLNINENELDSILLQKKNLEEQNVQLQNQIQQARKDKEDFFLKLNQQVDEKNQQEIKMSQNQKQLSDLKEHLKGVEAKLYLSEQNIIQQEYNFKKEIERIQIESQDYIETKTKSLKYENEIKELNNSMQDLKKQNEKFKIDNEDFSRRIEADEREKREIWRTVQQSESEKKDIAEFILSLETKNEQLLEHLKQSESQKQDLFSKLVLQNEEEQQMKEQLFEAITQLKEFKERDEIPQPQSIQLEAPDIIHEIKNEDVINFDRPRHPSFKSQDKNSTDRNLEVELELKIKKIKKLKNQLLMQSMRLASAGAEIERYLSLSIN